MANSSQNKGKTPILLLKTKSSPHDGYEEYFSSFDYGSFDPVFVPVLEHRFKNDSLQKVRECVASGGLAAKEAEDFISKYGAVIFTSQRAVEAFTKVINHIRSTTPGSLDGLLPASTPLYVVGPATARGLRSLNLRCPILGEESGNGEALAAFILNHYDTIHKGSPKPPILFLVGEKRRDIIPKTLESESLPLERRSKVDELVIYETAEMQSFKSHFSSIWKQNTERGLEQQWVVVFSPTGCKAMLESLDMLDGNGKVKSDPKRQGISIATIGPTTRDYLETEFGFTPDVCAEQPSPEDSISVQNKGLDYFYEVVCIKPTKYYIVSHVVTSRERRVSRAYFTKMSRIRHHLASGVKDHRRPQLAATSTTCLLTYTVRLIPIAHKDRSIAVCPKQHPVVSFYYIISQNDTMARTNLRSQNKDPASGTKRKADANSSPESKRGKDDTKKKQKTIEQTVLGEEHSDDKKDKDLPKDENESDEKLGGEEEEPSTEGEDGNMETETNGKAIEKSPERAKAMPSNILEKGVIYFFTRKRVGIDDAESAADLKRTYFVMRPLPIGAKLGEGSIDESKSNRLFALPKKVFPKTPKDRFTAFVEKANTTMKDLKEEFFQGSTYETQTAGTRHNHPINTVGEGVYAITRVENSTHLVYMLTIPSEPGEVQEELGLRSQGSFAISIKNPTRKGPANASLPQGPDFPKEIIEEFRGLAWAEVKPNYLDYPNAQILLIGEANNNDLGTAVEPTSKDQKNDDKETPLEEMEKLEHEDELRVQHLHGDDSVFDDLKMSKSEYPKVPTTW
ncbi:tetrapyrrole biosynthesis, uroporphyrinogen III synthase [Mytilinidion resinicola]|uniref:Tetrapyrrole biosynthesis, uroporphyrinogen III synthase n=1 Tax=Mytilinidion resinicola TaxID=574789 RepID=A0A6A6YIP3_9PEZI|nr:tetrapyrrole biosynthesis, uroporphyrinogen III synthase [Mytilinidion resinicola]KAF2807864.1 tetrapyrrole biosynthesis, uroporphyrinogen III synthase [Mytilinidion resinicola]